MQQYSIPLRWNTILLIPQRNAGAKINKGLAYTRMVTGLVLNETSLCRGHCSSTPSLQQESKINCIWVRNKNLWWFEKYTKISHSYVIKAMFFLICGSIWSDCSGAAKRTGTQMTSPQTLFSSYWKIPPPFFSASEVFQHAGRMSRSAMQQSSIKANGVLSTYSSQGACP